MSQHGFTLVEVLLSVAILTLLTGLSLPVYEPFVLRNDLDITAQSIVSSIRRAETYSRANNTDNPWGVEFLSTGVTLFQGATYATRNSALDETIPIPGSVTISGITEIDFTKLSATPSATGSVTLTSTTGDTRTITVNAKGMVDY